MLNRDRHDPTDPEGRGPQSSVAALEETGDVHFGADAFSPAQEYYDEALRTLGPEVDFDPIVAARLNRKISDCLRQRGQVDAASVQLEHARGFLKGYEFELEHGLVLGRRAELQSAQGCHEEALADADLALQILKRSAAHREYAFVLRVAAVCHLRLGRVAEFEQMSLDALAAYRRIEDEEGIADVYNNLGLAYKNACQWDKAVRALTRARDIAERLGMTRRLARTLGNLGIVYTKTRDFHDAVAHLRRARKLGLQLGDDATVVSCLNSLGRVLVLMGKYPQAEKYFLEARVLAERNHLARSLALVDEFLGDSMLAQGRLMEARENYEAGLKKARAFAPKGDVVGEILRRIAELELRSGLRSQAIATARRALRICEGCGETHEIGFIHRTVGLAEAGLGHVREAIAALQTSIDEFDRTSNPYEAAWTRVELARVHLQQGGDEALRHAVHEAGHATDTFRALEEDHGYCAAGLLVARAHLTLGDFDDGLLALYDVQRMCEDNPSFGLAAEADALRRDLESALMTRTSSVGTGTSQLFSDLYALARSRDDFDAGMSRALDSLAARAGATAAFLAVRVPGERDVRVLGRLGTSDDEAAGLSRYLLGAGCRPRVLAQVDAEISAAFPGLAARAGAVLWHPLCAEDRVLGVVYLERQRVDSPRPFGPDDVDLVATYASMTGVLLMDRFREQFDVPETQPGRDDLHPALRRIITTDAAMFRIMGLAQKVAASNCTVLLAGETGTGKGLLAHSIHLVSERRNRKFLAVNCAALPEPLLESELFGHARGAFTGADSEKMGLFEAASGGTVFLDEVGKTSLFMQGKLLQFLDSSEVRPVGSNTFRKVDVRVIVATKGNLKELVSQGLFLEDLYYRLNDFPITIPPLRARRGDIRPLVDHYLRVYADEMHKQIPGVSRQAMQLLEGYAWPGNVRELEKSLKRAVILGDDRQPVTARHLPDELKTASGFVDEDCEGGQSMTLRQHVAQLEANLIQACLRRTTGNKSEAARMLGISYPSLLQKIKLYGAVAEVGDL